MNDVELQQALRLGHHKELNGSLRWLRSLLNSCGMHSMTVVADERGQHYNWNNEGSDTKIFWKDLIRKRVSKNYLVVEKLAISNGW